MYVHPDMAAHPTLWALAQAVQLSDIEAVPTSSGRTVMVQLEGTLGYLKLHDERYLGRIRRRISLRHAASAIETDSTLRDLVDNHRVPDVFAYLREPAAWVYSRSNRGEELQWGMVWRTSRPYGRTGRRVKYVVPAFSLFAHDIQNPTHETLLLQIGRARGGNASAWLVSEILAPLVHSYFALLLEGGLQGEWHAQNVLFGFDGGWQCVAVILRDLESVDRDIPMMKLSGRSGLPAGYPYKCLESDNPYYAMKHSFMFDHKLGEYLLQPLIDHACSLWHLQQDVFDRQVIDIVAEYARRLPPDFFPADGGWYKYENTLIDQSSQKRSYIRLANPRFRDAARVSYGSNT
jgi:hypothetical protein